MTQAPASMRRQGVQVVVVSWLKKKENIEAILQNLSVSQRPKRRNTNNKQNPCLPALF